MKIDLNDKRVIVKAPIPTHEGDLAGFVVELAEQARAAGLKPVLFAPREDPNAQCPFVKADLTLTDPEKLTRQMSAVATKDSVIILNAVVFDDSAQDVARLTRFFDLIDNAPALDGAHVVIAVEAMHLTKPFFSGTVGFFFRPTPEQEKQAQTFDSLCRKRRFAVYALQQ